MLNLLDLLDSDKMGQLAGQVPLASSTPSRVNCLEVSTKKSSIILQPSPASSSPALDNRSFLNYQQEYESNSMQMRFSNETDNRRQQNGNLQYVDNTNHLMAKQQEAFDFDQNKDQVEQYACELQEVSQPNLLSSITSSNEMKCNNNESQNYNQSKYQINDNLVSCQYQQQSYENQFQIQHQHQHQHQQASSQFVISEVNGDLLACDQPANRLNEYVEHDSVYANWSNSLDTTQSGNLLQTNDSSSFIQSNFRIRESGDEQLTDQSYNNQSGNSAAYQSNDYNNNQQHHSVTNAQTSAQDSYNQGQQYSDVNIFHDNSNYHHHHHQHQHHQIQYHDNYNYHENGFVQQSKFEDHTHNSVVAEHARDEHQQIVHGYEDPQHVNTLLNQSPNHDRFYSHPQQRQQYFQSTERLESQEGPIDTDCSNNNQHQPDASFNQHPTSQLDHYNSKSPYASLQQLTLDCDNYTNQVSTTTASNEEPLQATNKLRSLKGRRGRPRKKGLRSKNKVNGKLWEFIRDLLLNERTNPSFIRWERREDGVFKFVQSDKVAKMWGERKQNPKMTYEKLSRAMRYYYKSKVLLPVFGRRLVYKFGPNATGWLPESSNGTIY